MDCICGLPISEHTVLLARGCLFETNRKLNQIHQVTLRGNENPERRKSN